jgi:glycosyltransferase involved in cell wall biosynthesis
MPRVLFVSTVHHMVKAFLLPFSEHFRSKGWQVDVMAQGVTNSPFLQGCFDNFIEIQWSRNPLNLKNVIIAPKTVKNIILQGNYDLVHVHSPIASFLTRFALRNVPVGKKPTIIYTAHGFHFFKGGKPLKNIIFKNLERLAGKWTDFLVAINIEDKEAAEKLQIVPPDRVYYMPGIGVDLEKYNKQTVSCDDICRIRCELGLCPDDIMFLMIAEFIPRKRHKDVLLAFSRIKNQNIHLALAGQGVLQGKMKEFVNKLGLSERVHFLGMRQDIPALIRSSVAVILSSSQEGLPRSLMEALCLEVPCIATNIRGTKELIKEDCGFLYKVGNVNALCEAIESMANDQEGAKAMGTRGRFHMNEFSLESIVKRHEELYEIALSCKCSCESMIPQNATSTIITEGNSKTSN